MFHALLSYHIFSFVGCQCRGCRCSTRACPCFAANRECDPDLCRPCDGYLPGTTIRTCNNVGIQNGVQKQIMLGRSEIHGWGAFCKDGAQKGDLITEYVGEVSR